MSPLVLVLAIGVAGALGAVTRYAFSEWTMRRWQGKFPLATFLINISGTFVLGVTVSAGTAHVSSLSHLRTIAGTGFLGGYTTFSTLSYETHDLTRRGHHVHAWLNAAGTLLAGIAAAALGVLIGHML